VAVYRPDEDHPSAPTFSDKVPGILCDVQLTEPGWRGVLRQVPILTRSGGIWDLETWVPRAGSVNVTGGKVSGTEGSYTSMSDLDGDLVVVDFLDADIHRPIIVGQLPHPRTLRAMSTNDGDKYRMARWVSGIKFAVTDTGGVEVDLSDAGAGTIDTDGSETNTGDGSIKVTLADGGEVLIEDGANVTVTVDSAKAVEVKTSGGTTEKVLQGETLQSDLNTLLTSLQTLVTAMSAAVSVVSGATAGGEAVTGTDSGQTAIVSAASAFLSSSGITTMITRTGDGTYLADHLKSE